MEIVVPQEYQYLYERNPKRPIVKIPNPVLRSKARNVDKITPKLSRLVDDLFKSMRVANGVGLAAPQLGISQRVIVIAPEGMKPLALINPEIVRSTGEYIGQEGCLSIPGLYGDVKRPQYVMVEAEDRKGRPLTFEFEGMPAKIVQHEIDHLDGVLFIDKVDISTLHWSHPDGEPDGLE